MRRVRMVLAAASVLLVAGMAGSVSAQLLALQRQERAGDYTRFTATVVAFQAKESLAAAGPGSWQANQATVLAGYDRLRRHPDHALVAASPAGPQLRAYQADVERVVAAGRQGAGLAAAEAAESLSADALLTGLVAEQDRLLAAAEASSRLADALTAAISLGAVVMLAGLFGTARWAARREQAARTEELAASEARLHGLLDQAGEAVLVLDGQDTVTYASEPAGAVWGVAPGELVGRPTTQLGPEVAQDRMAGLVAAARAQPEAPTSGSLQVGADSTARVLELTVTDLSGDPAVGGVVLNARDVTPRWRAEQVLAANERLLRHVLDHAPVAVSVADLSGRFLRVNSTWSRLTGIPAARAEGATAAEVFGAKRGEQLMSTLSEVVDGGLQTREERVQTERGELFLLTTRFPLIGEDGRAYAVAAFSLDITDRREVARTRRLLSTIVTQSVDAIITLQDGRITSWNSAAERLFGYSADEALGGDLDLICLPDRRGEARQIQDRVAAGQTVTALRTMRRRKDGSLVPVEITATAIRDESDAVVGQSVLLRDVSEQQGFEEQLWHQARHDGLTGLPNRQELEDQLAQRVSRLGGPGLALLFVDLDHFKLVNDSLGHGPGDQLLVEIAHRMRAEVGAADLVARLGGDEFAVIRDGVDEEQARELARQLLASVARPVVLPGGDEVVVTASAGVALGPTGPAELLRDADTAMYAAKRAGRNRVRVFTPHMRQEVDDELALRNDLRSVVGLGQLATVFQPIVALRDSSVLHLETLLRWQHPTRGAVPPDQFIPLAEDTGAIRPIGRWVLRDALTQLAGWRAAGFAELRVAVNVSVRQLVPGFVEEVSAGLAEAGLSGSDLVVEITESALVEQPQAEDALRGLSELGAALSVDDFGTGYSSLSYLTRFPVSQVKIDRSFVQDIAVDPAARTLVHNIVALAAAMDLQTVAEGVETVEQREILADAGCDYGQGFLWSPGVPGEQVPALLGRLRDLPERQSGTRRPVREVDGTRRRILELHTSGASPHTIAAVLNREGVPGPHGRRWHHTSVAAVLAGSP